MRTRGRSTLSPAVILATTSPIQRMVPSEASTNCASRRMREARGAALDLAGERLLGRGRQRLGVRAAGRRVRREAESVQPADGVSLDDDFAGLGDFGFQHRVLS